MTRFFNSYGDTPHLQAIEDSYLQYLEQQHAKESHLKAVKKFQIMFALKKIQKFWKKKYAEIRLRCLTRIQRASRRFIASLRLRQVKLGIIRKRLLLINLQMGLVLYIKKRRMNKSKVKTEALRSIKPQAIAKMQALVRGRLARRRVKFLVILRKLRLIQMVMA